MKGYPNPNKVAAMSPLRHIREHVFNLNQVDFGVVAQVDQSTVSRWENGTLDPSMAPLREIRKMAKRRRLKWNDTWFFEIPKTAKVIPKAA